MLIPYFDPLMKPTVHISGDRAIDETVLLLAAENTVSALFKSFSALMTSGGKLSISTRSVTSFHPSSIKKASRRHYRGRHKGYVGNLSTDILRALPPQTIHIINLKLIIL